MRIYLDIKDFKYKIQLKSFINLFSVGSTINSMDPKDWCLFYFIVETKSWIKYVCLRQSSTRKLILTLSYVYKLLQNIFFFSSNSGFLINQTKFAEYQQEQGK